MAFKGCVHTSLSVVVCKVVSIDLQALSYWYIAYTITLTKMNGNINSISMRLATLKDAEEMLQIHHGCIDQIFPTIYSQQTLREWKDLLEIDSYVAKTRDPGSRCYVAVIKEKSGEKVVGYGCLNTDAADRLGICVDQSCDIQIDSVYVSVNHHRQGIGKMLMQELESKALYEGGIRVGIVASMTAVSFYERLGYSIIGTSWYNTNPEKMEDKFSEGISSLEARVMVKDLVCTDLLTVETLSSSSRPF